MSVFYRDITSPQEEPPEVHELIKTGGFSVQMSSNNTFGRIPVDQTVNKDTDRGWNLRFELEVQCCTAILHDCRVQKSIPP